MVLLATLAFVDDLPPEDWVPRGRFHHQFRPDAIQHEPDALDDCPLRELKAMGHTLKPIDRRYGDMQVVLCDRERGKV